MKKFATIASLFAVLTLAACGDEDTGVEETERDTDEVEEGTLDDSDKYDDDTDPEDEDDD